MQECGFGFWPKQLLRLLGSPMFSHDHTGRVRSRDQLQNLAVLLGGDAWSQVVGSMSESTCF